MKTPKFPTGPLLPLSKTTGISVYSLLCMHLECKPSLHPSFLTNNIIRAILHGYFKICIYLTI